MINFEHRVLIERHLAENERHVAQGKKHIEKQLSIIAALERVGGDIAQAKALLATFEQTQRSHLENHQRLMKELG